MTAKQASGNHAEARALAHLQQQRLTLLAQNYRCRHGEIDLIMQDGAHIVFVEVRRRGNHSAAAGSIDEHKQRRLTAAAAHYLSHSHTNPPVCRFDAVLIDHNECIQWVKNAFEAA